MPKRKHIDPAKESTTYRLMIETSTELEKNLIKSSTKEEFKGHYVRLNTPSPFSFPDPRAVLWKDFLIRLKAELFYMYLKKFELTTRERFIYEVFETLKTTFDNFYSNDYLYQYITMDGRPGLNNMNLEAKRYMKRRKNINLKLFLFYFKNHYSLSQIVYDNMEEYISVLEATFPKYAHESGVPLIKLYLKEEKDEDYLAPKIPSFEKNIYFRYLFFRDRIKQCLREAENILRNQLGFKNIGEGNVQEQLLYNEFCKHIDKKQIKKHYRPTWLNGLELDFYIDSLKLGIEYQGQQHVRAVDYFGGKTAFKKQIKRDSKKLKLCHKNGVRLIYCYFDQSIEDFVRNFFGEIVFEKRAG